MIVVADTSPPDGDRSPRRHRRIEKPESPIGRQGLDCTASRLVGDSSADFTSQPRVNYLGRGEREAIQLAEEQRATLLLIDERKGQSEASRRGLATTGTLGVLLDAGEAGLIDPPQAYRRLIQETTFRTSRALEAHFLGRFLQ